jgi:hypothetical protein
MAGHTTQDEQVRQGVDDVGRVELAIDADCKAFPGELVDDVEHAESPAIVGPTLDKVIGPDMVRVLGPQPDARSVLQPEATPLRLLVGNLKPSRRQIRSTRLAFTVQPSDRSIAVILR